MVPRPRHETHAAAALPDLRPTKHGLDRALVDGQQVAWRCVAYHLLAVSENNYINNLLSPTARGRMRPTAVGTQINLAFTGR